MLFLFLLKAFCVVYATCAESSNCKTCHSNGKCIACKDGFYYPSVDGFCVLRNSIIHCKNYDQLKCTECEIGYYLDSQECKTCTSNCDYCTETRCIQCAAEYTLIDSRTCKKCDVESTNAGLNYTACGRCDTSHYFDVTSKQCNACVENCLHCTTSDNCLQCKQGFYNTNNSCVALEHCDYSYGEHCEVCASRYYLEQGRCYECSDHCLNCMDSTRCVLCDIEYTLFNGNCVDTIANCKSQNPVQGCVECVDTYYLTLNSTCSQCPSECHTCSNATNCLTCAEDYYRDERNICVQKDDNCLVADQLGCVVCDTLYYLETTNFNGKLNTSKTCKKCDENCLACHYNSSWCTGCTDNNLIYENTEATQMYSDLTSLSKTIYGCKEWTIESHCTKLTSGFCTTCDSSTFLKGIECIQCHESCASCTSSSFCESCKNTETEHYWRPPSQSNLNEDLKGFCHLVDLTNLDWNFSECSTKITTSGCNSCHEGYYSQDGVCSICPSRCFGCKVNEDLDLQSTTDTSSSSTDSLLCTSCRDGYFLLLSEGVCKQCEEIASCLKCDDSGCLQCSDGYTVSTDALMCNKKNTALVVSLVIVFIVIFIIIVVVIISAIIWKKRREQKQRETEIRPFRVSSDIEMALLTADNENFPLKTDKWELTFGLKGTKAIVNKEYTEKVQVINSTTKQFYYEILANPSHRYNLQITPMHQVLNPGYAIEIEFKITLLCTAMVKDDVGIIAMDVDENNKETAKIKVLIESDLSTKLDHTELKPIMPAIGEGAFGLVFKGTYRGLEVAIKKMKARNMTEEQEKEFNHEVTLLQQLRHQMIVNLIGAVYTEGEVSIVTEFAEYGSLSKIWGKYLINLELKVKLLDDLAVAIEYLHRSQFLHRDIKGENVLVYSLNHNNTVCGKLTDFGTCRSISESALNIKELSSGIGTPTYMSPESLQGLTTYSYPVDIYAFGVVMYETFIEKAGYTDTKIFNQPWVIPQFVIEGKRLERPKETPDYYWTLLEKCWAQNPEERPSAIKVVETIATWDLNFNKYYITKE
ncbi:serine-threonine protein kinase, putative [Entamoeba invadens IP1]|uniref:Serine-threonine protein kinase, putative n=1 Tax=Entamoeba invadens IP1 TaxID=370355 RepID=A0A0A1U5T9_ENTIV|nr:serine-threonine protein kinase, putative [Entamoeba invadens IP1]ELP89742.1 serine-threonine protein kinase, putative [Entamoeba invadens IP1]|eukprot:XP_004256513.1 serine-threonine protein kinase, putative [Entamoeba invadens IP1]